MATAKMSQVNARMDYQLKSRGDAAFAKAGLTPTQAIRKLWQLAVHYESELHKLLSILSPKTTNNEDEAEEERRQQVLEAIDDGANLMRHFYEAAGFPWPPAKDTRSFEELKEEAYMEAYAEEMGWTERPPCRGLCCSTQTYG